MDIRELQFPDTSFDIAIDKGELKCVFASGRAADWRVATMDAMLTYKGDPWVCTSPELSVRVNP